MLSELNPYQVEMALCWIAALVSEASIYYCSVVLNTAVKKVILWRTNQLCGGKNKGKIDFNRLDDFFLWYYIPDILFASGHYNPEELKKFQVAVLETAIICIQPQQVISTIPCLYNKL